MVEEFNANPNTSLRYGLMAGISIAFKLSVAYAAFIGLYLFRITISFSNPFEPFFGFFLVFIFALTIGLIPSLVIGGLAGLILNIIFAGFNKSLTELKVIGTGFLVGIICAFLLVSLLHILNYVTYTMDDIPRPYVGTDWGLISISLITLLGIVWLASKVGKPYL